VESNIARRIRTRCSVISVAFPIDRELAGKLRVAATEHGISAETLVNLWLQEKIAAEARKAG
jgi:hypothetical protein